MKVEVGYVKASPDAANYHRWVWRQVIEATYGHQAYYLMASENGVTQGILPLFLICLAVRVWQHLPLGVANWLGPLIVRSIP